MDNEVVNFEVVVETILRHGVGEMERRFIEYAKYSFEQQHEIQNSLVSSGCLICIIWRGRLFSPMLESHVLYC
jgi:hypothetical protein